MEYSSNFCGVMLHGAKIDTDCLRSLFDTLYAWHLATNQEPVQGALKREGIPSTPVKFPSRHDSPRNMKFDRLEAFELYTPLPDTPYPNAQWTIFSSTSQKKHSVIICASTTLADFELDGHFARVVRTAINLTQPEYGYGFHRDRERGGPAPFYALGVPVYISDRTPDELEEKKLISGWGLQAIPAQIYLQGILRDVYPWNFLNATQQAMSIEGQLLKAWIEADPARGNLHSGYEPLTLWELTKSQCAAIRPSLHSAGILFNGTLPS